MSADGAAHHSLETGHAVVLMHHERPGHEIVEEAALVAGPGPRRPVSAPPAGHVGLGEQGQLDLAQDRAPAESRLQGLDAGAPFGQ